MTGTTHAHRVNATLVLLVLFLLHGCAAGPGIIEVSVSAFDEARETALAPSPLCGGCPVRLGLFTRSTMAQGSVILVVMVDGPRPIAGGESLFIRVGGAERAFTSIEGSTGYAIGKGPHAAGAASCEAPGCSVKRYLMDKSFLKSMIETPGTSLRVTLARGSVRGTLEDGDPSLALPRFRQFYARVFGR